MYGKAIWKPGMAEIVKASRDFAPDPTRGGLQHPLEPPAAKANMMKHTGLWPSIIQLNPKVLR